MRMRWPEIRRHQKKVKKVQKNLVVSEKSAIFVLKKGNN